MKPRPWSTWRRAPGPHRARGPRWSLHSGQGGAVSYGADLRRQGEVRSRLRLILIFSSSAHHLRLHRLRRITRGGRSLPRLSHDGLRRAARNCVERPVSARSRSHCRLIASLLGSGSRGRPPGWPYSHLRAHPRHTKFDVPVLKVALRCLVLATWAPGAPAARIQFGSGASRLVRQTASWLSSAASLVQISPRALSARDGPQHRGEDTCWALRGQRQCADRHERPSPRLPRQRDDHPSDSVRGASLVSPQAKNKSSCGKRLPRSAEIMRHYQAKPRRPLCIAKT